MRNIRKKEPEKFTTICWIMVLLYSVWIASDHHNFYICLPACVTVFMYVLLKCLIRQKHYAILLYYRPFCYYASIISCICMFFVHSWILFDDFNAITLLCVIFTFVLCMFMFTTWTDVAFFIRSFQDKVLYLRSFVSDAYRDDLFSAIVTKCEERRLKVYYVGNPDQRFDKVDSGLGIGCKMLFLLTSNWKRKVERYICRSQYVIMNLDTTNGILWEIGKCIGQENVFFIAKDIQTYSLFWEKIKDENEKRGFIEYTSLPSPSSLQEVGEISFYFYQGKWRFDNEDILNSLEEFFRRPKSNFYRNESGRKLFF